VRFLRENSLSLFFGAIFLASVGGQAVAGQHQYNADATAHGEKPISWMQYVVTPEFGGDLLENWQSEFLQFSLYILATIWLLQRGSNESKALDGAGRESDAEQKVGAHAQADSPAWAKAAGIRRWVYSNSLMLLMTAIFVLSWFGQSVNGWRAFNNTQDDHGSAHIAYGEYLLNADFWVGRCRTGNRSFSPSARWPPLPSTCASAARPSQSPSARRTMKPRAPARPSARADRATTARRSLRDERWLYRPPPEQASAARRAARSQRADGSPSMRRPQ
jgi:hypothetical protein